MIDICRNSRKKYIDDQLEQFEIMWNLCRTILRIHMMNDLSNLVESYLWGTFPIDIVWNQSVILCTLLFDIRFENISTMW